MLPVCLCIRSYQLSKGETIFMKFGMYIMAREPISTAYFIIPFHQSVRLYIPDPPHPHFFVFLFRSRKVGD
jgi:hypothetical protein